MMVLCLATNSQINPGQLDNSSSSPDIVDYGQIWLCSDLEKAKGGKSTAFVVILYINIP